MSFLISRGVIAQSVSSGFDIGAVFSIDIFTGAQTLVNGIDFDGKGGMFWGKSRGSSGDHQVYDTDRGATEKLSTNLDAAEVTDSNGLTSFNSNGVTLGSSFSSTQVGYSFRKQAGFFDVVTYVGDGIAGLEVPINLDDGNAVFGMSIVKNLDGLGSWRVQHRSLGGGVNLRLDTPAQQGVTSAVWNDVAGTTTTLTIGDADDVNSINERFISYNFAHNPARGIFCGEFDATGGNVFVDLGWAEGIQYIMIKPYDAVGDWEVFDTTRGMTEELNPNLTDAETTVNRVTATTTGFTFIDNESTNYIFMAIRAEA